MKILVISPGVLPVPPVMGGAVENMIARLHHGLSRNYNFHYVSVTPPQHLRSPDSRFDDASIHEIESINPLVDFHLGNHFELQESSKWTAYTDHCCAVARRIQPDIIHIHNEVRLSGPLTEAVPDARIIVHVNDEVVTRLGRKELQQTSQDVDWLLSCSEYIASQIRENFEAHSVPLPKMATFYNFVDCTEFDCDAVSQTKKDELRERYQLGDGPVVGFVGRMIEQKGPQTLIRAIHKLRQCGIKQKLLFVGAPWYSRDENTTWLDYLKGEAMSISSDVVFTGYVSHRDIPACLSLIDIMTVPSVWDDPSPFIAYEAQAMARPVISSKRGGIPEIIEDRKTGRCIDVYNTPLFAEILAEWIQTPSEARSIGLRGRERVKMNFSVEGACAQMEDIYEQLMS